MTPRRRIAGAALALTLAAGRCSSSGSDASGGGAGAGPELTSAPPVVAVEPASGSDRLSTSAVFRVRFASAIEAGAAGPRVHVMEGGRELEARVRRGGDDASLVVDPAERLPGDAAVELRLDAGLATRDGVTLAAPLAFRYRTGASDAAAEVAFDPLAGEIRPWPSDVFTVADPARPGGLRIELWNAPFPSFIGLEREGEMDGFDPSSRIMVALSGPIDLATLPPDDASADAAASVILTVADPAAPGFGVPIPFLARYEPLGLTLDPPSYTLMIRALRPLAAGTRHALVVTRRVRGAAGGELAPSAVLEAALTGDTARLADPRVAADAARLRDAADALAAVLPLGREDVAGMTVFTTATEEALTSRLRRLIDAEVRTAATTPPRFRVESTETRGDEVIVHGTLSAHDFRGADGRLVDARFARVPVSAPAVELGVLLSLPRNARQAPVVIYGHGIDASKEQVLDYSDAMAAAGLATVGIDFAEHGSRYTGSLLPALSFFHISDLPAMKDSVRQTIADLVQLELCVAAGLGGLDVLPLGAPDGVPDVDGERIGYLGESFGGILGTIFVAVDPALDAAALMIAGGTWTDVITEELKLQPGFGGFDFLADVAHFTNLPTGLVYTAIAAAQNVLAPGDPLAYAPHVLADRWPGAAPAMPLLQLEVIDDDVVPNPSNESLARALGVPQLVPAHRDVAGLARAPYPATANGPGGLTAGLVQYRTFADGGVATHTGVASAKDLHDHVAGFLAEALAGQPPTILPAPADRRP